VKISKAVITAAGRDQRNLPLQALVDHDGASKPVLRISLEEVLNAGVGGICVVVCPDDRDAFSRAAAGLEAELRFVEPAEPRGYGHALACARHYGSVFLALGLHVRNPIVPAAVLLAWEGANGILPHVLQKMSVLYYLQSLCPVPAPMDDDAPTLIRLLASPAAPASRPGAVLGLLLVTAVVLWIAGRAVRRMQISYGAET
jgi:hypothetical protein